MAKCTGSLHLVMQFVALHCLRPQVACQHVAALPPRVRHPHTAAPHATKHRNTQHTNLGRPSLCVRKQPLSAVLSVDMHPYTVHVFKPFSVLFPNHNWGGPCVLFFRLFEFSLPSLASRVHLPHQTGASPPTLSFLHQHRQPHASPRHSFPHPPLAAVAPSLLGVGAAYRFLFLQLSQSESWCYQHQRRGRTRLP